MEETLSRGPSQPPHSKQACKQVERVHLLLHDPLWACANGAGRDFSASADRELRQSRPDNVRPASHASGRMGQTIIAETGFSGFRGRIWCSDWRRTLGTIYEAQGHQNPCDRVEAGPYYRFDHSALGLGVQSLVRFRKPRFVVKLSLDKFCILQQFFQVHLEIVRL